MTNRSSMPMTSAALYQVSPVTQPLVVNNRSGIPAGVIEIAIRWDGASLSDAEAARLLTLAWRLWLALLAVPRTDGNARNPAGPVRPAGGHGSNIAREIGDRARRPEDNVPIG